MEPAPAAAAPPEPELGAAPRPWWRSTALAVALLVAATLAAHGASLGGVFFLDDENAIERNPAIRGLWPPGRFLAAPAESPAVGRPLASFTFALDHALWGLDPRGFHATNLALHALAAVLLLAVVRGTLRLPSLRARCGAGAEPLALAVALLWAVHPLQTECVAYVSQRTEVLMGAGSLAALAAAIRAAGPRHRGAWSVLAALAALAAAAGKEVAVVLPLVVALHDRAFLFGSWRAAARERWPLWLGLASSWVLVAWTMSSAPRSATVGTGLGVGAWDWLLNQAVMITTYLGLFLWPRTLVADYGTPLPLTLAEVWPQALLVAGLVALSFVLWRRRKGLGFLALAFFLVLAPTSSVVPIVSEVGAERRVYLSSAALCVLAVLAGERLLRALVQGPARRARVGAALVLLAALGLGLRSAVRHRDYRSSVSIWTTVVEARPASARARKNLAVALHAEGRLEEALAHYGAALELPQAPLNRAHRAFAHFNVGLIHQERGELAEAAAAYRRALRERERFPGARNNLGLALLGLGRPEQAVAQLRRALADDPGHADAARNLARALEQQADLPGARDAWRVLLELRPADPEARASLARVERALAGP